MGEEWQSFLGQEAISRGRVSERQLRTEYRRVYRNVYVAKSAVLTAADRAHAAWLWSGGDATVIGRSAAALFGTKWVDPDQAAELCRLDRRHPPGIRVHTFVIPSDDVCWVGDVKVTTPERTALDIGRLLTNDQSVPVLDALLQATAVKVPDVLRLADRRRGIHGGRRLRDALALVDDGAESPQESRLRLTLVRAGLPAPQTQIPLGSRDGVRIRVDMGWPRWKVAVEYDGIQHWTDARQRSWDIERINLLESLGWTIVRVSAEMLSRPEVVVERVKSKLRQGGWPN